MGRQIIQLQRSIAEAGRIRIGQQVPTRSGGRRPAKLGTFRLTSADRRRIEQAAVAFGGKVAEWEAPAGAQWEVITERSELDVIVPPADLSFSQAYELWSAGGCQRRCDGVNEEIGQRPCVCDPAARECDIHTRLSLLLTDLPGFGVWRLDTQGYYAATELRGVLDIIHIAAGVGRLLPARLRLDQRSVKRPGPDGKPTTYRFAVPVLDVEVRAATLLEGAQGVPLATIAAPIAAVAALPAPLTPVPALPAPSIAEQAQAPEERAPRANAAAPIPASGRSRRRRAAGEPDAGQGADAGVEPAAPSDDAPVPRSQPAGVPFHAAPAGEPEAGATPAPSTPESTAGAGAEAAAQARPSCAHPADRATEAEAGLVCGACGELLELAPDLGPAIGESGTEYWMRRLHAVAAERNVDHGGIRLVAAAARRVTAGPDFSLADQDEHTLEGLDKLFRSFPAGLTVDGVTEWVHRIAVRHGLGSWEQIDPLAAAAIGGPLNAAGVADWIAFGLRLHAGEFDPAEPAA